MHDLVLKQSLPWNSFINIHMSMNERDNTQPHCNNLAVRVQSVRRHNRACNKLHLAKAAPRCSYVELPPMTGYWMDGPCKPPTVIT